MRACVGEGPRWFWVFGGIKVNDAELGVTVSRDPLRADQRRRLIGSVRATCKQECGRTEPHSWVVLEPTRSRDVAGPVRPL